VSDFSQPTLSVEGSRLLEELSKQANDLSVLCQQDPILWDAETESDAFEAKQGCNGKPATDDSEGFPPCPIKDLCYKTGVAVNAICGVWGGHDFDKGPKRRTRL
jgi:hypothetical protein